MLKFIHAADIHLDSPMWGLPEYPGAPVDEVRGATRKALEAMVDLALDEGVDLVLIAGDLYDGDWPDYHTGLFLAAQMTRLRQAEIRVVIARGNHDAASRITRTLKLPDNVVELSTAHPQSVPFDDLGVVVHGQGFRERHVPQNVTGAYPSPRDDLFNIGMLHTSAGRAGHDVYAPCTEQDLRDRGYQFWALGHIHKREIVSRSPWICFPGNLQGRHIRETGPKGCLLVTVDGETISVDERDVSVVRWEQCKVSSAGCGDGHDLLERVRKELDRLVDQAGGAILATRIVVADDSPARSQFLSAPQHWINEARQLATDLGAGRVWVEKLAFEATPMDAPLLTKSDDAGDALALLERLDLSPASLQVLQADPALRDLVAKLPPDLREEGLNLDEETLLQIAPRARALLLGRLRGEGEDE